MPVGAALAARLFVAFCFLFAVTGFASAEMKIQEVTSSKGVKAWLVEDYSVPIIAIRFAFDGGSSQDPVGKEGLTNLMSGLFDEGAGDLDSETFPGAAGRCRRRDGFFGGPRCALRLDAHAGRPEGRGVRTAAAGSEPAAIRPAAARSHPLADRGGHSG
jgi:predicted Zn-dependent peptidase